MFLPRGWWHSVYNIEHTVALTQNFATWHSLEEAWESVKQTRRLILSSHRPESIRVLLPASDFRARVFVYRRPDILAAGWLLELAKRRGRCLLSENKVSETVRSFIGALLNVEDGTQTNVAWLNTLVKEDRYSGLFEKATVMDTAGVLLYQLKARLSDMRPQDAEDCSGSQAREATDESVFQDANLGSLEGVVRSILDGILKSTATHANELTDEPLTAPGDHDEF